MIAQHPLLTARPAPVRRRLRWWPIGVLLALSSAALVAWDVARGTTED